MNEVSKVNLNSSKSAARPSHEAIEHSDKQSSLDRSAEDSAKRAQNRMKNNEENMPETTIFSK